jgi:hypothetical protein
MRRLIHPSVRTRNAAMLGFGAFFGVLAVAVGILLAR